MMKRVEVFALSIYSLVVFPKALGHVDEVVTDLFDRLDKKVTPVSAILTETFKSLNACRGAGEEEDVEWKAPWLLSNEICIGAVILIGSLCLEFGELLVIPRC
ncbi:hypothetical protein Goklo_023961 [Gossypium klotzschianum]|uniref:DUF7745 domain-containing protein n=1 Tax=Gossypium klotzschianum TaxID=34286 RepID=A0A7J8WF64_9ROSI|nr:hypothetical protein [Gossypium klotzschianum]